MRYPLLALVALFFLAVFALWFFFGLHEIIQGRLLAGTILVGVALFIAFGGAYRLRQRYNKALKAQVAKDEPTS